MSPTDESCPGTSPWSNRRTIGRGRRPGLAATCLAALLPSLSVGCSPTLDWREQVRPDVGVVTTFPCRPDRHAREVGLGGRRVHMEMLACAAGGATYAVGFFDVGTPDETSMALSQLRSVWAGNLQSKEVQPAPAPPRPLGLAIRGMAANPQAGQWLVAGQRPDGTALTARGAFFNRGLRVYQAVVIGGALSEEAVEPFFAGLRFPG